MKKLLKTDIFAGLLLGLAAFLVYLKTLAPSVRFEDCGELAAVASTLGIAHPTGYPLFTLLGWMAAHFPLGLRVILKLNLLMALFCSMGVFFFYRLFALLLSEKTLRAFGARQDSGLVPSKIPAIIGALVLAFSQTYWSQAVSFEVYSLHLLFLSVLIFLFLRSILAHVEKPESQSNRIWYLFALTLGLSFANHMTTVLLAPAFLYLYFSVHGFGRNAWSKIGKAAFPFFLGLSLYLYLPWRANHGPLMDWGNPVTLRRLWWHVSGEQFHYEMFSSFDVLQKQLKYFLYGLPSEFGYAPLPFALVGLVYLFRRLRRIFVFSLLLFFGCLFYSINYDIADIDSYFLLAYIAVVIWMAYGVYFLLGCAKPGIWRGAAWVLCAALALCPLILHYQAVDESGDYVVEDYARNMLNSLEPGAVILTDEYDYFTSPAYYLQLVEGVRPDVAILDMSLLTNSWYYLQLGRRYPWLIENSRPEIEAFLPDKEKLLHGNAFYFSPGTTQLRDVIQDVLSKSYAARPVYVTRGIKPEFTEGFQRIPSGLAFRLARDSSLKWAPSQEFLIRPFPQNDAHYIEEISELYALAYLNEGVQNAMRGNTDMAAVFFRKALVIKPGFPLALEMLERLGQ